MAVYSHRTIRTNAIPRTGRLQDSLQGGNTVVITNGNIGSIPTGDFNVAAGDGINITPVVGVENKLVISHKDTSSVGNTGNLDDVFIQNLTFDEFGHVTGIESVRIAAALDDRYIRKDIDDYALGNIVFHQSIGSVGYLDGWDGIGWKIENTGLAELDGARIRSDVFLGGKVGSPSFASGFTGWGWEIDTPTASGTVDNWTVRKSMKVYELVYSQLYGLSGSVMITDFNKIKSVEPLGTNRYRCVIDDMDGEMFMNLRNGDIVRVQKRDGWNIRYYYGEVENVSSDAFDIKVIDGQDTPQEGDVCFRMGSKTDKNRQGLVYLTSSDDYSAYIDILDGIDGPSFEGKTKVRLGNLRGLTVNGQPLNMHGIYINGGIFQHSTYYMENGNTVEQQFTIMDGKLESSIEAIRNDMSVENGNILRNSGFSTDTNYWTSTSTVHFIPVGDGFLWLPSAFYVDKESVADIYRDGSRNVLRIKNCSIRQINSVLNLPERSQEDTDPKEYSFSFFYRVLRAGTLTAGFSGSELYVSQVLEPSENYQKLSKVAQWNEQGDFELSFTGEILIYAVSLFNDALADAVVKLETRIEQTEEYIKLLATKEYVDSENESVITRFESELQVTAEQISGISTKVNNINNTIETSGWITRAEGTNIFAKKEMENGSAIVNAINVGTGGIKISANRVDLVGQVTFNMLNSSLQTTINGKVNSSDLGDLALLDKIEKAQLGTTIISGGYIKAELLNVTHIEAVSGHIAGFTIKNTQIEAGDLILSSSLISFDGGTTKAKIGKNAFSGSTGTSCPAYFSNTVSSGGYYGNGSALVLGVGNSSYTDTPQRWIQCTQEKGWGGYFAVEARYLGDANSMNRTCVSALRLLTRPQVERLSSSNRKFYNVVWEETTGFFCYEW